MATTRLWPVKSRLDHLVKYVADSLKTVISYTTNDDKTLEKQYVTCLNCSFADPRSSMENTKKMFNDESKIIAFHGYQSFEEDEVDANLAHQIGVEFAKKMWGDCYEVIVTTHLNTDNIHNHFLLNSTSFVDGKRYCNTYNDIQRMRNISDEICKENNLSVIENKQNKGISRASYFHERTLKSIIKEDIDEAISISFTMQQFYNELILLGYEIKKTQNNIAIKHPFAKKFIRLKSLGNQYTNEKLMSQVLELNKQQYSGFPMYDQQGFDIRPYYKKYQKGQLNGFQRLVLHYQYLLKIIPKDNRTKPKFEVRQERLEAIKNLDSITQQTIILCKNNIETIDDLNNYVSKTEKKLLKLEKLRQQYRNKVRYCSNENEKDELKNKAKLLTPEIAKLKKELIYCKEIETRSLSMKQFINKQDKGRNIYDRN